MMNLKTSLTLIVVAAALSACSSYSQPRPMMTPVAQTPTSVEGTWSDPNGLISSFQGGAFSTRTTDEKQAVLATGTYYSQPNGLVEISLYSVLKKTTSRVNCALAGGATQLNCTSDSGGQFTLLRRS